MKSEELKILMDNLRDFLNCSNVSKLSKEATNDLFDNLIELDTAMETSALSNVNSMDLVETFRLLDQANQVECWLHPFVCAVKNGMKDYLDSKRLLGNRTSHEDRTYELSRQNSLIRNISKDIVDKPKAKTQEELSASKEESLDRVVDLLIRNSYRKWSSK
jgi:hypothetical protein